jgi:hypothetical protein
VEVDEPQQAGQFEVLAWEEAYLRGGVFDPDGMLRLVDAALHASSAQGFARARIIGHMEWALENRPGVNRLLEYEARVNDVLARHKGPALCVYGISRFSAALLIDVLRTHPLVLIGGMLRENPFFVPPDVFLRELYEHQLVSEQAVRDAEA